MGYSYEVRDSSDVLFASEGACTPTKAITCTRKTVKSLTIQVLMQLSSNI